MELKKNPNVDYQKKYILFLNIGLVFSLLLVISAFEWQSITKESVVNIEDHSIIDEMLLVPITEHEPPPKPKPKQINLIEIENDEKIEVDEIEFNIDIGNDDKIKEIVFVDPPEEKVEIVHDYVQVMPSFEGGMSEFYKFISNNLVYPAKARKLQIEGKVFVHFIVGKDGSLHDVKVVRGIGAGCDEEVLRVINKSPKWNPGRQSGRPVQVRMMVPISFKLQ